jgi:hypothetical protein
MIKNKLLIFHLKNERVFKIKYFNFIFIVYFLILLINEI